MTLGKCVLDWGGDVDQKSRAFIYVNDAKIFEKGCPRNHPSKGGIKNIFIYGNGANSKHCQMLLRWVL